ncbi:MAG: 16S rRNA (adenine(1518)-N(6)/adenine(1519)-N(6))-dimethyltransferase RsmA [Candidatus Kuenenbacteria bacterium]
MENIKSLCEKYGVRPQRQAGQNFLIDKKVLNKIIKTANLEKDDVILEIGPGFGILTQELVKRVKKVIAIELDKRMAEALKEELKEFNNLEIINKDILKMQNAKCTLLNSCKTNLTGQEMQNKEKDLEIQNYKIVANIPYNITSAILRKFLSEELIKPNEMILLIQKEVGQRIIAKPGEMSLFSVSVQFYSQPKIISIVSKNSFWPKPKVDSAIIKIVLQKIDKEINEKDFFNLVRAGFSSRRKQLKNNLKKILKICEKDLEKIFQELNFNFKIRAQELSIEDWIKLYKKIYK